MIPELGQLCLILAFLASMLQGGVLFVGRMDGPRPLLPLVKPLAAINCFMIASAFAALIYSYVVSDFSVVTVVENSHSTKPLLYKIVGAWGNHEGSMLLWMLVLGGCGFLLAWHRAEDAELKYTTLSVLGLVSAGFLAFILFTSNPFLRSFPIPAEGDDMNPILQDIGLAFHPPTLYVGYVGFGVVFAYAVAGMLLRRIDRDWARAVHPWILLPWSFLTLGIAAGSWWAYRELGWGGWWFWDPVENVSLLPWLVGTALVHSNMVLARRGQLGGWVVLLAILTFTLSLIGTFIVRSGLITSVHAFAADPLRGLFILGYIGVVSGAALLLYSIREIKRTTPVALLSRSGFILLNNLLLVAAAGVVLIAILYPLALQLIGAPSISVGAPYFNATFLPLTAALPLLAALAPLMAWDKTMRAQLRKLLIALAPAVAVAGVILLSIASLRHALGVIGVAFSAVLIFATVRYLRGLARAQVGFTTRMGLRHIAAATAHLGLALFVLGMTTTALLKHTYEAPLTANAAMQLGDYTLRLIKAERLERDNFTTRRAVFSVARGGIEITTLAPELRYYPVRATETTEAALYSTPLRDIYLVIGESNYGAKPGEAALGVRMYVTPGQQLIWAGFLLAGLGGLLALVVAFTQKRERE